MKNLLAAIKDRAGNLLQGVGSKRVAVGAGAAFVIFKVSGANPNVQVVCYTLLGVAYIVSEMVDKLKK